MVQAQILDLLAGLVADLGVGLLIISHDLSVLADVCDRVAVMYAGRVVEAGPAEQVFDRPAPPVRPGAVAAPSRGSATRPRATRRPGLAGDPPDPRDLPAGLLVRAALPARGRRLPRRRAAAASQVRGPPGRLHPGG